MPRHAKTPANVGRYTAAGETRDFSKIPRTAGRRRAEKRPTLLNGEPLAPIISGQVKLDERERFDALQARTGWSASKIARLAILRLLADDLGSRIDWAFGVDQHATALRRELGLDKTTS